jgi:hypothetical protein
LPVERDFSFTAEHPMSVYADTVKLLKDHLLRVPLQMESHTDAQ